MERPVMNPMFLHDADSAPHARRSLLRRLCGVPGLLARVMLANVVFWRRHEQLQIEDGSVVGRLFRLLVYRLLFAPLALLVVVATMVYLGTHPPRAAAAFDQISLGAYFDPVSFASADGTRLDGWFVPLLDARTVLEKKDQILRLKSPAVLLVHDHGASRLQMLPLVKPLHDAGYVVLVTALRGGGMPAGSTFGLKEASDVQAALDLLSRRSEVDKTRLAVLGVGTGATAAALASVRGGNIRALVLDHPVTNAETLIAEQMTPPQPWLAWTTPLCKWGFELAYRVDIDEIEIFRRPEDAPKAPTLLFGGRATKVNSFRVEGFTQVRDFLAHHLAEEKDQKTAALDVR